ncbi:hypothetical protein GCM10009772_25020 [Pseudonocardia alni subsp. carboxydivorans]
MTIYHLRRTGYGPKGREAGRCPAPLPIGIYGAIHTTTLANGEIRASTRFRDLDGVSRKVGRTGASATAAKNRLREHPARPRTVGTLRGRQR